MLWDVAHYAQVADDPVLDPVNPVVVLAAPLQVLLPAGLAHVHGQHLTLHRGERRDEQRVLPPGFLRVGLPDAHVVVEEDPEPREGLGRLRVVQHGTGESPTGGRRICTRVRPF
jgi:hypothetical protein